MRGWAGSRVVYVGGGGGVKEGSFFRKLTLNRAGLLECPDTGLGVWKVYVVVADNMETSIARLNLCTVQVLDLPLERLQSLKPC